MINTSETGQKVADLKTKVVRKIETHLNSFDNFCLTGLRLLDEEGNEILKVGSLNFTCIETMLEENDRIVGVSARTLKDWPARYFEF